MSLIRWSPMWDPFDENNEAFNRLPAVNSAMKAFTPAVDIYETDKSVVVETPLAGFSPEDVKVSVEKGVLTLQGEHHKEHEIEEKNYHRKEVRSGSFFRQIALPTEVSEDKVEATFEDGILKIECPKLQLSETKKVEIKITKKK
ncbi:MAG: Hsp20/alpha crystallin family protein [Candidatus Magasanikbacteria bacterium]|nr:Hsp20/alpha crystallin family protein [Candidatus Magasanikbacteria bacterium]